MQRIRSNAESLWKLLERDIKIDMIAENLWSAEDKDEIKEVKEEMGHRAFDVAGFKKNGRVTHWISYNDLSDVKTWDAVCNPIELKHIIATGAPLWESLKPLAYHDRMFLLARQEVCGIVTLADINKQPARLLMFGLISLLEMILVKLIRNYYPENRWQTLVEKKQLKEAQSRFNNKKRLNQESDLLDCLLFSDIIKIAFNTPQIQDACCLVDGETKEFIKNTIGLRNDLAHSQNVHRVWDWRKVVNLLMSIERFTRKLINSMIIIVNGSR